MIARLRGTITKGAPGEAVIDVQGVGYKVSVPLTLWDELREGDERVLEISSYIREDRFDLFGFADTASKKLFEEFIEMPGVGPKTGLELCSVPRDLLINAVAQEDHALLTSIKGVGKKTAERLLVDLKNLLEKMPEMASFSSVSAAAKYDQDAIDALSSLGYNTSVIMKVLKDLPADLTSTEERVAAALRHL